MGTTKYTLLKNHKIFIILQPKTKEFYIHFSSAQRLDKMYSSHFNLKNSCTAIMFQKWKETDYIPEMYLLEEAMCTVAEAEAKVLIWIRYFIDHEYVALNKPWQIQFARELYPENLSAYNEIKDTPIQNLLISQNRRCTNYGRKQERKPNGDPKAKHQVKFVCNNEEWEIIKAQARRHEKTPSAYIREIAKQGFALDINYKAITDHTREVSMLKNNLIVLIKFFVSTGTVYPIDVAAIVDLMEELVSGEKTMLQEVAKEREKVRELIIKELKKNLFD